jgi:hypothetical protein
MPDYAKCDVGVLEGERLESCSNHINARLIAAGLLLVLYVLLVSTHNEQQQLELGHHP